MPRGVLYDDSEHTYTLGGVRIPSLTEMLAADGLTAYLAAVPAAVLAAKAEWGTRLHRALAAVEYGYPAPAEFAAHAEAWLTLCRRMGWHDHGIPIWKNCEIPAYAQMGGYFYGFTPDRASPSAVVEIKGTYSPQVSHGIQTALQVLGMDYPPSTPRYVAYFDGNGLRKLHSCVPTIRRPGHEADVYAEASRIIAEHALYSPTLSRKEVTDAS